MYIDLAATVPLMTKVTSPHLSSHGGLLWNECQIPVKEVIKAIGHNPLYGNRSGKQQKTHWMAFIKEVQE